MNWNEWIELKQLKWKNWNEWIEMQEVTWMNELMNELKWMTVSCTFSRPHLPQVFRTPQSFTVLCDQLLDDAVVDIWNRARATVSCTFSQPHLPKVLRDPQFFNIFKWKSSLATVLCAFCPLLSPIETRNRGNRDSPPATTEATFAPESLFKPEFTHSQPDDDVLTWWCGWHNYRIL